MMLQGLNQIFVSSPFRICTPSSLSLGKGNIFSLFEMTFYVKGKFVFRLSALLVLRTVSQWSQLVGCSSMAWKVDELQNAFILGLFNFWANLKWVLMEPIKSWSWIILFLRIASHLALPNCFVVSIQLFKKRCQGGAACIQKDLYDLYIQMPKNWFKFLLPLIDG